MNIYWRIGSYGIAIAAFVGAATWYGHTKYQAGYNQANLEANAAATKLSEDRRKAEQLAQKKANDEYEKFKAEKVAADLARNRLANLYDSLRNEHAAYRRRMSDAASDPIGASRTGQAAIDNYESCAGEFTSMAGEYAEVAGRLNGLIEQCKIGRQ